MRLHALTKISCMTVLAVTAGSCIIERNSEPPELGSLQQGIRTSAAIGYCASLAVSAHLGLNLPANVNSVTGPGFLSVAISGTTPMPFNKGYGNVKIASLWNGTGGVMSVLFTGINPSNGETRIYGLYAVPVTRDLYSNQIKAFYADQDIIIGNGSDTILDLSSITAAIMNSRLDLLETEKPGDAFVAVKQNFWIIDVNQNNTTADIYDDDIIISGGGQIAEVEGETGGVIYHALIDARLNHSICSRNPVSGFALSQNFKAGGSPLIDLGNSLIRFHATCDGKAHVELSTGKYLGYTGRDIFLDL